jgi:hypothetical protein
VRSSSFHVTDFLNMLHRYPWVRSILPAAEISEMKMLSEIRKPSLTNCLLLRAASDRKNISPDEKRRVYAPLLL